MAEKSLLRCWILVVSLAMTSLVSGQQSALLPTGLKVEYSENPIGIDVVPRLSWRSESAARGARQTGYQIQAAETESALSAGKLLWDSGKVKSDQSLFIPYGGPSLQSGDRVSWRIRLWDQSGQVSAWSRAAFWEMGLLQAKDWRASWIRPAMPVDTSEQRPVVHLRKRFVVDGEIQQARLYATARGIYELELNGQPVGDQLFTPGWTSYHHRIQYQTYDVTSSVKSGVNVIGAMLADGWYRGYLGYEGKRNLYGDSTALRAQLVVTFADGREQIIGTDDSWRYSNDGPYRMADIYRGEIYDARKRMVGWSTSAFDDATWSAVESYQGEAVELVAPQGPPVKRIEEIRPKSITKSANGEIVVDMGQNIVGWVRLSIEGEAGTEITLRHAEVLDPEGNLYTENLRTASAMDRYILDGKGDEVYEPRFTFHGFRYVGVSGYTGELTAEKITGVVIHSDMAKTGSWESSNALLNQLYQNIVWGQKGNFLDVPTDCPQRDERLGWTGDAQVFAPTAAFNMNVSGFFAKWLKDLALDQHPNGSVPHVIPDMLRGQQHGSTGWADAATTIPWAMYRAYGDKELLRRQFSSMKAWVDFGNTQAGDDHVWRTGFHFGDWLAPEIKRPPLPTYQALTEADLISTAYYAHSADLTARAAEVLGMKREEKRYRELFEKIREGFQREFVAPSGRVLYDTQTAYALALAFDLLPDAMREKAAKTLATDVKKRGNHLSTGFLGTPELTHVLGQYGHLNVAYDLLTQTTYPSWLFPVTFGATTIWERWDAIRTDGTFQTPEMTSFNHYAYGAIGEWMVNTVAGLNADAPGYKKILIQPRPGGNLSHTIASLETPYGKATSGWSINGSSVTVTVEVPPNAAATVVLPLATIDAVTENSIPLRNVEGASSIKEIGGDVRMDLLSGLYRFSYSSSELALQAAAYQVLSESTPMVDMVKVEEVRALLAAHLPEPLVQPLFATSTDASFSQLLYRDEFRAAREAVIKALPEINQQRRAAILTPKK